MIKNNNLEKPRTTPDRDDYYMGVSFWIASKSKDPKTQVGAYIVGKDNLPISFGYNGPPSKILDQSIDWARPNKYNFVHHAENNAIWHGRNKNLEDAIIYITARPCKSCMLDIVRSGIKRVVYFVPKTIDSTSMIGNETEWQISLDIAKLGLLQLSEFEGNLNWMRDRMKWMESMGVFD
jgi:dCMP deaminase